MSLFSSNLKSSINLTNCRYLCKSSIVSHGGSQTDERKRQLMARGLPKRKSINGVDKVILVASGKGGVGKSTVAANLAVGLKLEYPSQSIGLLDADVYGPSLPLMMNLRGKPEVDSNNLMIPLQNHGIKCMSMGFLTDGPIIWRGLMVMQAISDLLFNVKWDPVDILVIDMPPGTGDTQLSIVQSTTIHGALIVTSPQKVAVEDSLKGAEMLQRTNVPLLGYVLNMSSYSCPSCNKITPLKSTSNAVESIKKYAKNEECILGQLPFEPLVSETSDEGNPIVLSHPNSTQKRAKSSAANSWEKVIDMAMDGFKEIKSVPSSNTNDIDPFAIYISSEIKKMSEEEADNFKINVNDLIKTIKQERKIIYEFVG